MFTITSTTNTVITPEMASDLLSKNNYMSQRNLNKSHVVMLRRAIESGDFHIGSVCVARDENGDEFLMNGQHQLNAVLLSGVPIKATVIEAHCPTRADLSRLFAQFDVGRNRSLTDIVTAEVGSASVKWHWRTGSLVAASLNILLDNKNQSRYEKAANVTRHIPVGNFVNQFMDESTKHIWKAPVIAAMIKTYWKDREVAKDFWNGVAYGEMLKSTDARMVLREYLISIKNQKSAAQSRKEIIAKCVTAWNAYRCGKKTSLKYFADRPIPAAI